MRSPVRGEPDAFRALLVLVAVVGPLALAAALAPAWVTLTLLGIVGAALVLRLLGIRAARRRRSELPIRSAPAHAGPAGERRVLVVANDALEDAVTIAEVERLARLPGVRLLVLAPASIPSRRRLTGAIDRDLAQARERLERALARVGNGLAPPGVVSDADPVAAVEDALAAFAADEVIVCTRPARPWSGLEPRLAGVLRGRCAVPVRHLVLPAGARVL